MKKLIIVIACLLVCTFAAACGNGPGEPSPSDAVCDDLDEFRLTIDATEIFKTLEFDDMIVDEKRMDELSSYLMSFDYELIEEKINDNKAEVVMKITTFDFGKALKSAVGEAFRMAFTDEDINEKEISEMYVDKLITLENPEDKTYSKEITFNCVKEGDTWATDVSSSKALQKSIYGGLDTVFEDLFGDLNKTVEDTNKEIDKINNK